VAQVLLAEWCLAGRTRMWINPAIFMNLTAEPGPDYESKPAYLLDCMRQTAARSQIIVHLLRDQMGFYTGKYLL
jgi:hypothetical protein